MRASLPVLALLALAGCGTAEPTTAPPVVLPSHDPLPTAAPTPSPTPASREPHRVVGENLPDDPEVRAAMEAYIAYETAMFQVNIHGGTPETAEAALALVDDRDGRGNAEYEARKVIAQAQEDGPVQIYGETHLRLLGVLDRRNDAVQLAICVDNSAVSSPDRVVTPHVTNGAWMARNSDGEWLLYADEIEVVAQC